VLSEDAAGRWLTEQETRELLAAGGLATRGAAIDADEAVSFRLAVVCDARFGALVRLGTSGPLGELLGDVVTRLTPIAAADADEFVRSLRSAPLLLGYGGRPPSDVAGLADLVARVAALADELPEVAEIVLDPVLVGPTGVGVPNARVRVSPAPPLPDPVLRRLR
jgi:hypothetical protein